jgi:hypothetical protein
MTGDDADATDGGTTSQKGISEVEEGGLDAALQYLCAHESTLWLLFFGSSMGLVVTIPSILYLDPKSGSYVVARLNLVGLMVFFIFSLGLLIKCRRDSHLGY